MTTERPLRVAIGPFDLTQEHEYWPVYQSETLAPAFDVLPFGQGQLLPEADALIIWSPEYHQVPGLADYPGYRVACYGDWHIVPFERCTTDLALFHLIATDLRGTRRLAALGHPPARFLWFRMFSFDPRLHHPHQGHDGWAATDAPRDLDLAFLGRPDGGPRDAWLRALANLCDDRGWTHYLRTGPYRRGLEAKMYRQAQIVVNRSARGELNMRTYEAAACGALVLVEQDNAEVYAADAPLPPYQDAHLAQTLATWLGGPAALAAAAARQHEWVQHERPVDHLGWLCRRIRERLLLQQERQPRRWGPTPARDSTPVLPAAAPQGRTGQNGAPAASAEATWPLRDVAAEVAALPLVEAPSVDEQRREVVTLLLEHQPTARTVLDVGCGRGGLGWWFRQQRPAIAVTGLDSDPAALNTAALRLAAAYQFDLDGAGPYHQGAMPWAPTGPNPSDTVDWYRPGAYDAIVCADILEHLVFPQRCLARLRPLLAPEGVLIASIPNLRNAGVLRDLLVAGSFPLHKPGCTPFLGPPSNIRCFSHLRFWAWADLEPLFAAAGYTVVREATQCTLMAAPGLERFVEDLGHLVQIHGGDAEAWKRESLVMQFLVVARPNWQAVAAEG